MTGRNTASIEELVTLLVKEVKQRILLLAAIFSAIALATLAVALLRPKKYEATAVLLVEPRSTITPAIGVHGTDPGLVNQLVLSRKVLREILVFGGWGEQKDPRAEELLLKQLKSRIKIASPREELVRITYTDEDAQRCFAITKKLTEIYIRESVEPQEREAREVFDFVDKQVKDYAQKLADAHEAVLAYYRSHEQAAGDAPARHDPRPDPAAPSPPARPGQLSAADLAALRAEEATLTAELQPRRAPASPELNQAEARYRERTQQLQAELDRLMTIFTEEHPDVKRVRRDLAKAKELEENSRREREAADKVAVTLDDDLMKAARARLEQVQRKIAAGSGDRRPRTDAPRPFVEPAAPPGAQMDPDMRLVGRDAAMSELLRRYELNRDLYQDLLRRRENARVSLELAEQRGISLRVQDAAELPLTPVSARMMYVIAGGMLLALLAPLGLVFALVKLDPRVRTGSQIESLAHVPLLVSMPYAPSPRARSRARLNGLLAGLMVAGVLGVYATVFYIRYTS